MSAVAVARCVHDASSQRANAGNAALARVMPVLALPRARAGRPLVRFVPRANVVTIVALAQCARGASSQRANAGNDMLARAVPFLALPPVARRARAGRPLARCVPRGDFVSAVAVARGVRDASSQRANAGNTALARVMPVLALPPARVGRAFVRAFLEGTS